MKKTGLIGLLLIISSVAFAQEKPRKGEVLDKVIAVVGTELILKSDIEAQMHQVELPEGLTEGEARCQLLNDLMQQKMLLNRANIDSLEVSEEQVSDEINDRINYFVSQIGSESALEEYYGKSIPEIREEFYDPIHEQLLIQMMQQKVIANTRITPSEVKAFYNNLPKDSLPFLSATVEAGELVRYPEPTAAEKEAAKNRLQELRDRIVKGESFETLAVLYSDDDGTAAKKGVVGAVKRDDLQPEYSAVAFRLSKDSVSQIVETQYGYHIIQLIERRGDIINTRHILIRPKITEEAREKTRQFLDSIRHQIVHDTLTFAQAATLYSQRSETRNNAGMLSDPASGASRLPVDKLDKSLFNVVDTMKAGEVSKPVAYQTVDNRLAYRLIYLKDKTPPHKANLKDDYQQIQEFALENKKIDRLMEWVEEYIPRTYVRVDSDYSHCEELQYWMKE
ncbi:MAG: peptidylprolyl isomerase [Bacteroidia bacterium]